MDSCISPEWQRLSNVQRDILSVLAVGGELTVRELSEGCGETFAYQTISRNLSTLRGMGYVTSDPDADDNRIVNSRLTEDGRAVVRDGVVRLAERMGEPEVANGA